MPTNRIALLFALSVSTAGAAAGWANQPTTNRDIPQLANEEVRVWKTILAPKQPFGRHRHNHPRVVVALTGGKVRIIPRSGPSQTVTWETGRAYWFAADAPGEYHSYVNETAKPVEFMVVELEKAR